MAVLFKAYNPGSNVGHHVTSVTGEYVTLVYIHGWLSVNSYVYIYDTYIFNYT